MDNERMYWAAFASLPHVGPQIMMRLYRRFGTLEAAWQASAPELREAKLLPTDAERIARERANVRPEAFWETLQALGIGVLTITDADYPPLLKEIHSPPAVLFYRGDRAALTAQPCVAIVGARKTSTYGRQVTPELAAGLAQHEITVVSGLALGIDCLAHEAALDAGGLTVAVVGSGLDEIYPLTNRHVGERLIASAGCIISEYPPGVPPLRQHFPARNRIIAGMCRGTVVVEGAEHSGSLITARMALEANREVMAVPGSILSPTSVGPHRLLKYGAALITSAEDILNTLNIETVAAIEAVKQAIPPSPNEAAILQHLAAEPMHIDEIVQKSTLNTSVVNAILSVLEIKGMIVHVGGMRYCRARAPRRPTAP